MKRFTNKNECLVWLTENYSDANAACDKCTVDWLCSDKGAALTRAEIKNAFKLLKGKEMPSPQVLESECHTIEQALKNLVDACENNTGKEPSLSCYYQAVDDAKRVLGLIDGSV